MAVRRRRHLRGLPPQLLPWPFTTSPPSAAACCPQAPAKHLQAFRRAIATLQVHLCGSCNALGVAAWMPCYVLQPDRAQQTTELLCVTRCPLHLVSSAAALSCSPLLVPGSLTAARCCHTRPGTCHSPPAAARLVSFQQGAPAAARMFGKTAFELLQEVAQCPAENLPAFNVSGTAGRQAPPGLKP